MSSWVQDRNCADGDRWSTSVSPSHGTKQMFLSSQLNYQQHVSTWPSGELTFECQLPKTWQIFWKKNNNFWQFFWKSQFLTFKWQVSGVSADMSQLNCREQEKLDLNKNTLWNANILPEKWVFFFYNKNQFSYIFLIKSTNLQVN